MGGLSPGSEPIPPTSASFGRPAPFSPWQARHFSVYTASPCFGVPLPAGNPAPSGPTLRLHAAISCAVTTRPRSGPSAATAALEPRMIAATAARTGLRVGMLHLALLGDAPGRDRVRMIKCAVATAGNHLLARGLHVSGIIDRAALQNGRASIPAPRQTETGQRFR